ncbi:PFL_4703 family integrating conjugative element protein [Cardiobacterium valvarum]|uniref:Integrating conjugative element protein, PFL_4703 family n=1 Tax=Cardiobacterium valvarum F0432 TaxID=797473 RepID=G9ZG95_9GAMM|nr:TIGR03746 family integrating conjugative element protein [Cardiobacterium valvarum]EHM53335.1 integrating conjugative element protein, PFL_4703 family [Cardiobacterium valvarum F0432]
MSVHKHTQESAQYIRFQNRVIAALFILLLLFAAAYWRFPKQIVTYLPPDVSKGFVQRVGEVPPATVYGFARTVWEELNYCATDCSEDYPKHLDDYAAYLTANCRAELKRHYEGNRGLYGYRSRMLLPTDNARFSEDRVRQTSNDSWQVALEYALLDQVNGREIRNTVMSYPLKVVRSGRPLAVNQLGLEVDCYYGDGPQVLSDNSKS